MLCNWIALAEHDDVGVDDIQCDVDHDGDPDQHSVRLRKAELQHERANAELECRHCRQIEVLAEPKIHQVFSSVFLCDRRVIDMPAGTDPS